MNKSSGATPFPRVSHTAISEMTLAFAASNFFVSLRPPTSLRATRKHSRCVRQVGVAATRCCLATEGLNSEDFLVRIKAVTSMASAEVLSDVSGADSRVNLLIPIAQSDPQPQVRFTALGVLTQQPRAELSSETLSRVLSMATEILASDAEPSCRCGAADLISGLGLLDGYEQLLKAYDTPGADWMLKLSILAGLGELKHPDAFDLLCSVVDPDNVKHEKEPLVLAAAIGALGDLGDKRALPIVEKIATEDGGDEAVVERAKIAVSMLENVAA